MCIRDRKDQRGLILKYKRLNGSLRRCRDMGDDVRGSLEEELESTFARITDLMQHMFDHMFDDQVRFLIPSSYFRDAIGYKRFNVTASAILSNVFRDTLETWQTEVDTSILSVYFIIENLMMILRQSEQSPSVLMILRANGMVTNVFEDADEFHANAGYMEGTLSDNSGNPVRNLLDQFEFATDLTLNGAQGRGDYVLSLFIHHYFHYSGKQEVPDMHVNPFHRANARALT